MAKNASISRRMFWTLLFHIVTALILIKLHKTAVTCHVLMFWIFLLLSTVKHPIANEKTVTTIERRSQEGFSLIIVFSFIPFNRKASKCLKTLKFKSTFFFSPFLSLILKRPRDGREGVCDLLSFISAPFVYSQSGVPACSIMFIHGKAQYPWWFPRSSDPRRLATLDR